MLAAHVTAVSFAVACALLSVVVVLRRWAFIGEGISHAGYSGVGTAWLLSLAFPALAGEGAVYAVAVAFCFAVAMAIAYVSQTHRGPAASAGDQAIAGDAAIGIFVVASLAWGFLAQAVFARVKHAASPDASRYLLGDLTHASPVASVCLSAAVVVCLVALRKEIVFYTLDPLLAQVSGVRAGIVHYLLFVLLAAAVVLGMRLVGALLAPALLVLPGSTAMLLSRRLGGVAAVAVGAALVATVPGLMLARRFDLPPGPAVVLLLFAEFLLAFVVARVRRA